MWNATREVETQVTQPKALSRDTLSRDTVSPCSAPRPARMPLPPPPREPAVAVALSGGGFRATLSGLGVLRLLADAGLLGSVRHCSSVSGGSIANGLFACAFDDLAAAGFTREAFDRLVLAPFVRDVSTTSLEGDVKCQLWRAIGRTTRTDLLVEALDRRWFHGRRLADLPAGCRFVFNAANTVTSVRFGFERDAVGDYVMGEVQTSGTGLRVAQAVGASAAVPGILAPLELPGLGLPCGQGRMVRLVDGGVYDNSAMEAVDDLTGSLLVALNAGGLFTVGQRGRVPLLRDLELAQSLLYRQSTALRRRMMVERFQAWETAVAAGLPPPANARRGVLFGLATTMQRVSDAWVAANPEPNDPAVASLGTSFDRFPPSRCRALVHAGWWLAGATLSTYHPAVLAAELPVWKEPAGTEPAGTEPV